MLRNVRWRDRRVAVMGLCIVLAGGVGLFGRDAFATGTPSVGGTVFTDTDGDGTWDVDEAPRPDVPVWVIGQSASSTVRTDAAGAFSVDVAALGSGPFGVLIGNPVDAAGNQVAPWDANSVALPDGLRASAPGANHTAQWLWPVSAGSQTSFAVASCVPDAPCGPAVLGDQVWLDADGDGAQDPDEAPIAGATVTVFADGRAVRVDTTDTQGRWHAAAVAGVDHFEVTVSREVADQLGVRPDQTLVATVADAAMDSADSDAVDAGPATASVAVDGASLDLDVGFVVDAAAEVVAPTTAPPTTAAVTEPPVTAARQAEAPVADGVGRAPAAPLAAAAASPQAARPPATAAPTTAPATTAPPTIAAPAAARTATVPPTSAVVVSSGPVYSADGVQVMGATQQNPDEVRDDRVAGSGELPELASPLPKESVRFGGGVTFGSTLPRTGFNPAYGFSLALVLLGAGICLTMTASDRRRGTHISLFADRTII